MSEKLHTASYFCERCSQHRRFKFTHYKHMELINEYRANIVPYSDIHICESGLVEVNQLRVDQDYNIRSYEKLEMPQYRTIGVGIPSPKSSVSRDKMKLLHLTKMPNNLNLHGIIFDHLTKSKIKIGRFDHQEMFPITEISSELGGISMEVYPTGMSFTPTLEIWLQKLIEIMEKLPPTTLGLMIETIKYFADLLQREPTDFDLRFIKTILASHEVYFILANADNVENLRESHKDNFDQKTFENIERFVRILRENEYLAIKDFTGHERINMDLISLIYMFLILEDEEVITIERPGIIDS